MDQEHVLSQFARFDPEYVDAATLTILYAQSIATVSDRLTNEELRCLLVVGAYLRARAIDHGRLQASMQGPPEWRGKLLLH